MSQWMQQIPFYIPGAVPRPDMTWWPLEREPWLANGRFDYAAYLGRPRQCLVAGVGGACCSSCAEGKGCEGEEKPKVIAVGAVYVSDQELLEFGEGVGLMSADINEAAKKERANWAVNVATGAALKACFAAGLAWDQAANKCLQQEDPDHRTYGTGPGVSRPLSDFQTAEWTPFVMRWNEYAQSAVHLPGTYYNELLPAYKILFDRWTIGLGQKTRATLPKPPPSWWEDLPWGWIILGAAVVILPFAIPAITGAAILVKERDSIAKIGAAL